MAPTDPNAMTIAEQAQLLELATDAIFVRDLDGYLRYWNGGAEAIYGWTRAEAQGQRVPELLRARYPRPLAEIEAAVVARGHWEGVLEHVRRDGTPIVVSSRWVLRRATPGQPVGILQLNTDITAHRRKDEQLRQSEARFRSLLELAPDAMLVFDPSGRVALANRRAEEIFGFERGGLDGVGVEALMPERFRAAHRHYRAEYQHHPSVRPMGAGLELYAQRRDGSEMPVEISLSPVDTAEQPLVIAAIRDVTERKRAEADTARTHALELAQAEHLATLGEIAAGLAHEIKNPLAGIAAALEVMTQESDDRHEVMGEVREQVERIRRLIDDLLHYARPRPLRMERGNLNVAVARAVHFAAHTAASREVRVMFNPGPLPELAHDPEQIERMVANLVLNGVDAAPGGGAVAVATRAGAEGGAVIQVHDNGAGIPPAVRAKLFRPFFTTKGERGNGLGLPLCRRIAELHGGRIEASSRPGEGTTFTILLPRNAPEPQ